MPRGLQYLSSLTRNWTKAVKAKISNQWNTRELPILQFLHNLVFLFSLTASVQIISHSWFISPILLTNLSSFLSSNKSLPTWSLHNPLDQSHPLRAETKTKKEHNTKPWEKETSNTVTYQKMKR